MTLTDLGWNDAFQKEFGALKSKKGFKNCLPARLIRDNKITYGALFINEVLDKSK